MIASEIPQSKTGLASRGYLPTVQIVKSDPDERAELEVLLRRRGFRVRGFPDGETFLMAMAQETADIVLLDTDVPQASRQEALFRLNDLHRESFVILLSDEGALNGSSESLRLATYDILQRPFDIERLCNSIQNALRTKSLMHEVRKLKDELRAQFDFKDIIGTSAAHVQMLGTLRWLAESDGHVLLQGESGTGKKLAARTVHYNSRRADAPFLYVNCTILRQDLFEAEVFSLLQAGAGSFGKRAAGKWERANGGTLFLDGIDGMKPALQADLLRRLKPDGKLRLSKDYPPADVRFILSARRDLAQEAATGRFEPEIIDLLSPFCLGIPPPAGAVRRRPVAREADSHRSRPGNDPVHPPRGPGSDGNPEILPLAGKRPRIEKRDSPDVHSHRVERDRHRGPPALHPGGRGPPRGSAGPCGRVRNPGNFGVLGGEHSDPAPQDDRRSSHPAGPDPYARKRQPRGEHAGNQPGEALPPPAGAEDHLPELLLAPAPVEPA